MKKLTGSFFVLISFFIMLNLPAIAADPSEEIQQLKDEVKRLLQKIEDLEKRQAETEKKARETEEKAVEIEKKTGEAEQKITEIEKKAEKAEKKSLKDRVELGGEARFRIVSETARTDEGFYGNGKPIEEFKIHDETAFPVRIRLNAHVEVVPEIADFYARLTVNKRWGTIDEFTLTDPFDRPNSFVSSIGRDVTPRMEQAYMTLKLPYDITWYVGRLPGLDGPPSRQARSLFPRLFIDSEIDGTLIKWDAPKTFLDEVELPWTGKIWEGYKETSNNRPLEKKFATLEGYEKKVKERSGIILGYLKYDERKISLPDDADVYLGQAELKIGKDTAIILGGLYMDDWHMPNTSDTSGIPDIITPYYLAGFYVDTQLSGFQIYGAYYYSHIKIPEHTFNSRKFEGDGFPGHIWYLGFNTGDIIGKNHQICLEYAKGSDAWINPFNYRGFRRKGTVLQPANNEFYGGEVAGFYPFNAGVWDIYYDYYFHEKVRFRLGMMDFIYTKHEPNIAGTDISIFGSSKFQNYWWPYFEVNLSF
ncbi:MAG: DUF3373 family protein [Nitrospirae bacterium]|nr:DUF3373 family protein [Nitrospirota bacterium]